MASEYGTGKLWPSREQLFLLHAATGDGDEPVAAYRSWREGIDLDDDFGWDILRLLPLVYHNLHRLGFDDPLMGRLKGVYRRAWAETNQLFHKVRPTIEALTEEGLDVLLLKGMPLALSYYRNHALRPMTDVDVVVPFRQAKEATRVLATLGWRFSRPVGRDMLRFHHAVQCFGPDGAELDLHWHVTYEACTVEADELLWARTEPLELGELTMRQLDPTALLLHTVVHGVRWNLEPPIRWIPDSLTVLRTRGAEVDWKRLVELALVIEAPVRLRMGLDYLRKEFGAPVPAWVPETLLSTPVSLRERFDNAQLLKAPSRGSAVRGQWELFSEYFRRYWAKGPLDFVNSYSHYIRFRWEIGGRREIFPIIFKGFWKRIIRRTRGGGMIDAERTRPPPAATPATADSDRPPLLDRTALKWFATYFRGRVGRLVVFTLGASALSLLALPVLWLIRYAFDTAIPSGGVRPLVYIGLAIGGIRLIISVVTLGLRTHVLRTTKEAVAELRVDLLKATYRRSRTFLGQSDPALVQTRIVQDSERVDNFSDTLIYGMLPASFAAVVLVLVLAYLNLLLLVAAGLFFPVLWWLGKRVGHKVKRDVVAFQRSFEGFSRGVLFALRQIDLTRIRGYESQELDRQKERIEDLRSRGHRMAMSFAVHNQVQGTLAGIVGILILVVGGAAVARGTMTLGSFLAFYVAANMLRDRLAAIMSGVPGVITGNESLITLHGLAMHPDEEPYQGSRKVDPAQGIRPGERPLLLRSGAGPEGGEPGSGGRREHGYRGAQRSREEHHPPHDPRVLPSAPGIAASGERSVRRDRHPAPTPGHRRGSPAPQLLRGHGARERHLWSAGRLDGSRGDGGPGSPGRRGAGPPAPGLRDPDRGDRDSPRPPWRLSSLRTAARC